ncbi:uncharacterized protein LOC106662444 [Cimex lectularius]|uniref:Uncharacterized protein n=1 Tax=Cimex lectularius TaxID=79782 RepID=A0A8I6RE07_CIMLE|nr:uncharacterized protein LOC106662444 [Cimex lectularius]XP_014242023.1 uncharacterized protein LOC106662444 [Cimex lectularius]
MSMSMVQMTHIAAFAIVVAISVYRAYVFYQRSLKEQMLQKKEGAKRHKCPEKQNLDIDLARVKLRCSAVTFNVTGLKQIERKLRLKSLQVNHYNGLVHATCKAALNTGGPGFLMEIVKIAHQHDRKMKQHFIL